MFAILLAILYVWGRARERESVFNISYVHVALSTFITCLVISGFNGVNPRHAFFGDMTGMGIILVCAAAVVASVLGYVIQKNRSFIVTLISWSLLSSVVMVAALYGGESLMPRSAQGSTLGNNSYMGAYLLVNVCLALGLFITQKNLWQRILSAFSGLFIIVSPIFFNHDIFKGVVSFADIKNNPLLLGGVANGAVMGLGGAMIIIGTLFLIRSKKVIFQWIGAIGLIGVFVGIFVAGQVFMNPESSLHQSYTAEKNGNRFLFWEIASQAAAERPLLGWGMNGYSYAFQEHFNPLFFSDGYVPEPWTENPHNMFREVEVNAGILGLIAYVLFIGATGVTLFIGSRSDDKKQKVISIVMFTALFGYVLQNLFIFDTTAPMLMFYVIVGYSIGISKGKTFMIQSRYKTLKVIIGSITILFFGYIIIVGVIKPWKESVAWGTYTSKNRIASDISPQSISSMGFAGDTAVLTDKFFDAYSNNYDKKNTTVVEKKYYVKTFEMLLKNLENDVREDGRGNFRANWFAAKSLMNTIYITNNAASEDIMVAQIKIEKTLAINSNNPLVYYDRVQLYAFSKDYEKMKAWSRASIALAPQYRGGYIVADSIINAGLADKDFENYIETMRVRWCQENSPCASRILKLTE